MSSVPGGGALQSVEKRTFFFIAHTALVLLLQREEGAELAGLCKHSNSSTKVEYEELAKVASGDDFDAASSRSLPTGDASRGKEIDLFNDASPRLLTGDLTGDEGFAHCVMLRLGGFSDFAQRASQPYE
eukprot:TRINITY_DN29836_c0_g1_i12.p2 TRINITY_DN29836_c0_g1~~TRINITY_DN29836_c0_g1_i12.p2  ORF type:complete len:129 (-),score=27.14 TRINITY_DN29836_c0_g1_i12:358-744(-)